MTKLRFSIMFLPSFKLIFQSILVYKMPVNIDSFTCICNTHFKLRIPIPMMMRSLYFIVGSLLFRYGKNSTCYCRIHAKFVVISRVSSYTNKIHDISEWRWNKDDEVHVTADWSGPLIYFSHLLTFHHHIRTLSKAHLKALSIIFLSFLYYCAVAIWWIHV